MTLPWILGVIAALLHATAYGLYNVQTKKKTSTPNAVSWFIWALMAGLNASSFKEVTDTPHALQYMVGTFAAIATFVLALRWRSFDWPEPIEWSVLVLCLTSMALWYHYKDASIANATLLVSFFISFWPTLDGVWKDPYMETSLAWWVWTAAFTVNLTNNALSWNDKWMSIINPIILLVAHGSIGYLARAARKRHFPAPTT